MFRDRSLVPAEAVRLLALGALMERDRRYDDLATEIRFFTQRIVGPSLDLLGSSLELLRIEGLAEQVAGTGKDGDQVLRITDHGRSVFKDLMASQLRAPVNDVGRFVVLLKLRFLEHLSDDDRDDQLDLIGDVIQTERARAQDLLKEYGDGPMSAWLKMEVDNLNARYTWVQHMLGDGPPGSDGAQD